MPCWMLVRRTGYVLGLAALTLACSDDAAAPSQNRMYDQVQRLGEPRLGG